MSWCPLEVEECVFSVVLQVLTASGREVWVEGESWPGWGWWWGLGLTVRGFNPHVFDWPAVWKDLKCLLRLLFINQVGWWFHFGQLAHKNGHDQKSIIIKSSWLLSLKKINFYYLCMWTFWEKCWSFVVVATLETQWAMTALNNIFVTKCWHKPVSCYCLS